MKKKEIKKQIKQKKIIDKCEMCKHIICPPEEYPCQICKYNYPINSKEYNILGTSFTQNT